MVHPLEKELNAPTEDILEAIQKGFRAQVDVKGKLAELYLYRSLKRLESVGKIKNVVWHDSDGSPDFTIIYKNSILKIECKNVRNECYKKPEVCYKIEIQRTRNSKDGTNTRSYRVDYFDVLAVCLFNQTKKWEFRFIKSKDLEVVEFNPLLLKIMQKITVTLSNPWKADILETLE